MKIMMEKQNDIIKDLTEDKNLLEAQINMYKEEVVSLKNRLEYAKNLFSLYESVVNCAKDEAQALSKEIKELKAENEKLRNASKTKSIVKKPKVKKTVVKKTSKKTVKKSSKK